MTIRDATIGGLKIAIVALAVALVGVGAVRGLAKPQTGDQNAQIAVPDHWVAFTSDVVKSGRDGRAVIGRFYQGDDGSTRYETGPSATDIRVIDIKNIAQGRQYLFSTGAWSELKLQLHHPGQLDVPRYGARQARSAQHEGLQALQETMPNGRIVTRVPALNFFIVDDITANGNRKLFQNIKIGPVPASLFEPPPGMSIKQTGRVGGIIEHGPEDTVVTPSGKVTYLKH